MICCKLIHNMKNYVRTSLFDRACMCLFQRHSITFGMNSLFLLYYWLDHYKIWLRKIKNKTIKTKSQDKKIFFFFQSQPFHNVKRWPNILSTSCSVHTARSFNVRSFFKITHESVNSFCANVAIYFNAFK